MWDKPQALRQLANTLFGISLLLLLFGTVHYVIHLPVFALNAVQLTTAPKRVDPAQIGEIVRTQLNGNFFTVDLETTRKAFEKLPWVRKVSIRRHFPWRLEIELEEHEALATWNDTELVNTHGEVFAGETGQVLPRFIGQDDSAAEVARMYKVFGDQLLPLKHEVVQISLSPRRAWQLRLDNGMTLELGREQAQARLSRFIAVYPYSLARVQHSVSYVDLRYNNGFAAYMPGGLAIGKSNQS